MTAARCWVSCPSCAGSGYINGSRDPQQDRQCGHCHGDGLIPWRPADDWWTE